MGRAARCLAPRGRRRRPRCGDARVVGDRGRDEAGAGSRECAGRSVDSVAGGARRAHRARVSFFPGFELRHAETSHATIRYRVGGDGPPVLLLHGHPQTHAMWHAVAPPLAAARTVVCADLRGYGGSSGPPTSVDHEPYSKRAMARDLVELMHGLGHARFAVVGHDRGGRVGYRLALDHPDRVERLAVLDIVPTSEMWRRADKE